MKIRLSTPTDLPQIEAIFTHARAFMRSVGNYNQWPEGYPATQKLVHDIANGHSYVVESDEGEVVATFAFIQGEDATYRTIYEGEWLDNSKPYATIHRLASSGCCKGVADLCMQWCMQQCSNLRFDTHKDNVVLQNIAQKYGFSYCGIIHIESGAERLAYQKIVEGSSKN